MSSDSRFLRTLVFSKLVITVKGCTESYESMQATSFWNPKIKRKSKGGWQGALGAALVPQFWTPHQVHDWRWQKTCLEGPVRHLACLFLFHSNLQMQGILMHDFIGIKGTSWDTFLGNTLPYFMPTLQFPSSIAECSMHKELWANSIILFCIWLLIAGLLTKWTEESLGSPSKD